MNSRHGICAFVVSALAAIAACASDAGRRPHEGDACIACSFDDEVDPGRDAAVVVEAPGDASSDTSDASSDASDASSDAARPAVPSVPATPQRNACFVSAKPCEGEFCANVACVPTCSSDAECRAGHRCVQNGARRVCSPFCDPTACGPAPSICSGTCGSCQAVRCSKDEDCGTDICRRDTGECFPRSGRCTTTQECPDFAHLLDRDDPRDCRDVGTVKEYGAVVCGTDRACHYVQDTKPLPEPTSGPVMAVALPAASSVFLSEGDVAIAWEPVDHPVTALILRERPSTRSRLLDVAVWGFTAPPGFDPTSKPVKIADGKSIDRGCWGEGTVTFERTRAYYLVVQAVEPGTVVSESEMIPFVVGPGWKRAHAGCSDSGELPDSCANPMLRPQVCFQGQCWQACASDADCPRGESCSGAVAKGGRIRLCGL